MTVITDLNDIFNSRISTLNQMVCAATGTEQERLRSKLAGLEAVTVLAGEIGDGDFGYLLDLLKQARSLKLSNTAQISDACHTDADIGDLAAYREGLSLGISYIDDAILRLPIENPVGSAHVDGV